MRAAATGLAVQSGAPLNLSQSQNIRVRKVLANAQVLTDRLTARQRVPDLAKVLWFRYPESEARIHLPLPLSLPHTITRTRTRAHQAILAADSDARVHIEFSDGSQTQIQSFSVAPGAARRGFNVANSALQLEAHVLLDAEQAGAVAVVPVDDPSLFGDGSFFYGLETGTAYAFVTKDPVGHLRLLMLTWTPLGETNPGWRTHTKNFYDWYPELRGATVAVDHVVGARKAGDEFGFHIVNCGLHLKWVIEVPLLLVFC